eukprot:g4855.t1 g4855   contig18:69770-70219(+)
MGLSMLIQLPKQILDILEANPKSKNSPNINENGKGGGKREGNNNNGIEVDINNKRQALVILHENQPTKLKTAPDFHRKVLYNALRDATIEKPMFNLSTPECINYCFKGECTNNCVRKDAHKAIGTDDKRLIKLLNFREHAEIPTDPEFS